MKNTSLWRLGLVFLIGGLTNAYAQQNVPFTVQFSQVQICWASTLGVTYQIQYESAPNTWTNANDPVIANAAQTCVEDPYVANRLYRVIVPEVQVGPDLNLMTWIPSGNFVMGSPASEPGRVSNEGPQTQVTISWGFWMDKYEVTQARYMEVMGVNPSYHTGDLNRPVDQVTWYDATLYMQRLTERESLAGRLPPGYVYRLPTEAEWEYAARAGTTTPFHYGSEMRSGMANFDGRYEYPPCAPDPNACPNPNGIYLGRTTAVGSYQPNTWGLYDMHGNVWEWVNDWYYSSLPGGSVTDPQGSPPRSSKVLKGGRFYYYSKDLRSAFRTGHIPAGMRIDLGFRAVLAPPLP